jgi:hypothetical protein
LRIPFHPSKEVGIEESDNSCQDDKDARLAAQGVTQSLQNLKHDGLFFSDLPNGFRLSPKKRKSY